MAFANFFDRSATAASQVLANFRLEDFKGRLSAHVVALSFDDAAVNSPEGRASLDLSVRLLARIYPALAVHPMGSAASEYAARLGELAHSINDQIELQEGLADTDIVVNIGATATAAADVINIGSDGWSALLSRHRPVGSGQTTNPFGAGAAACFGAANVFRRIFADQLPRGGLDDLVDLSLSTYLQGTRPDRSYRNAATWEIPIWPASARSATAPSGHCRAFKDSPASSTSSITRTPTFRTCSATS